MELDLFLLVTTWKRDLASHGKLRCTAWRSADRRVRLRTARRKHVEWFHSSLEWLQLRVVFPFNTDLPKSKDATRGSWPYY